MRPNFGDRLFIVIGICIALGSCWNFQQPGDGFHKDQLEWLNKNLR